MTLQPLLTSELDCLVPMLECSISESNLQGKCAVPDMMAKLQRGYESRCMGAYVDNKESPKHVLIMCHHPGLAMQGTVATILRIFTMPEARGETEAVDVMVKTAENYARLHGASVLLGSSWIFRGARSIDALWTHYGFEPQERIFSKTLT